MFAGKQGLKFPLLADTDKAVAGLYGTLGPLGFPRRSVFIVDQARCHPVRPSSDRRADATVRSANWSRCLSSL